MVENPHGSTFRPGGNFLQGTNENESETTLVRGSNPAQQCAGPGSECFQAEQSASDCAVAQALCGTEPSAQGVAVSIGDVHAELLHQSRRVRAFGEAEGSFGAGEG